MMFVDSSALSLNGIVCQKILRLNPTLNGRECYSKELEVSN